MAKIEKLPSGSYRIRVYDKYTKKQKTFTGKTQAEVKMKAAEFFYKNDDTKDRTVSEIIDKYIEDRSSVLSPSTLRSYVQKKEHLKPLFSMSAKSLRSEDIQKLINNLSKKYSAKTVKNTYGLLSAALKVFYPDKAVNVRLPQVRPQESSVPSSKEVEELINNAPPELKKAILLASIGTLRRGEIASLTYGDINGNVIHVHSDMVQDTQGNWIVKDMPKTSESDRYIEFPKEAIAALGTGEPEKRVVKYKTPDSITHIFTKLRDRMGINCRFHDLRHYAASIMHAIGIPDQYIMARGGWQSDRVLKSVYRNVIEDERKSNEDKINGYFSDTFFSKDN